MFFFDLKSPVPGLTAEDETSPASSGRFFALAPLGLPALYENQ